MPSSEQQVQEQGVFTHGRLTCHHSVAPLRPLTFRQLTLKVHTEKQSKCKHGDFVTTSDELRGKNVFPPTGGGVFGLFGFF